MPKYGDVRDDGFIHDGHQWHSPKVFAGNRKRRAKYNKEHRVKTGRKAKQFIPVGYRNELLAAADLNYRCEKHDGFAYLNPVPYTKDDVFGKTSMGWKTFQIKTGVLSRTKKGLSINTQNLQRAGIKSDILVLVDDRYMRIRYVALKGALPAELPSVPTALCKGVVVLNPGIGGDVFPYLSSTAAAVTNKPRSSSSTATRRKTVPVAVRLRRSNGVRQRKPALGNLGKLED